MLLNEIFIRGMKTQHGMNAPVRHAARAQEDNY